MALTNAEKVRAYRERKKAQKEAALKRPNAALAPIMRTPFFEWVERDGNWVDFEMALDQAGIAPPEFLDDSDPKSFTGEIETLFDENPQDSPYAHGGGSLARADMMVGCLISAASVLAESVRRFKLSEIRSRISELEQSDFTDPKIRHEALADIVRLKKMLDQLDTEVRRTFPQWKIDGGN